MAMRGYEGSLWSWLLCPSDWQMTDILYLLAKMNVQQVVEKLGKHYNYEIL